MSHSVDKVRWITVWILAEETAANSLIRNLGSEGRETLSCESEWENGAQWASASCEWEFVCGKVCVWSRHLLTYVQVRNQASFNTSALTIVVVLILLLIWAKLLIFTFEVSFFFTRDQRTSSDIYIYIYCTITIYIGGSLRWFADLWWRKMKLLPVVVCWQVWGLGFHSTPHLLKCSLAKQRELVPQHK